eukprot:TRINITY_DN8897_c0_g3_i10.p3 TRINITY_DN8897_c0_g3~~TRINITY_DN8897_c0_g3_i10.p3  ORF type:complete len:104 (-),score=0.35 TRINITY_DN8897_c0_g3_i10:347-658(-)
MGKRGAIMGRFGGIFYGQWQQYVLQLQCIIRDSNSENQCLGTFIVITRQTTVFLFTNQDTFNHWRYQFGKLMYLYQFTKKKLWLASRQCTTVGFKTSTDTNLV